jgi:murein DD-endopeptidase MepM/ murein hydrolase activator NlpD
MKKIVVGLMVLLVSIILLFSFMLGAFVGGILGGNEEDGDDDDNLDSNAFTSSVQTQLELFPDSAKQIYQKLSKTYDIPWSIIAAIHKLTNRYESDIAGLSNTAKNGEDVPYAEFFEKAAAEHGVDANLLKAIAKQESDFNKDVLSHAGARGVMQLMPANCREAGLDPNGDCWDPEKNINAGAEEIARYLEKYAKYGDKGLIYALAAYNAGPARVSGTDSNPRPPSVPNIKETQDYVVKVPAYYEQFKRGEIPKGTRTEPRSASSKPARTAFEIEEFLDNLAKYIQNQKKSHEKKPETSCMRSLKSKEIKEVKEGKAGGYDSVTCAVADLVKNNWGDVAKIEELAMKIDDTEVINRDLVQVDSQSGEYHPPTTSGLVYWTYWQWRGSYYHKGVDIPRPVGTPIYAIASGKVTRAGPSSGFGNLIIVDHGNGLSSWYGHMFPSGVLVKEGQYVRKGQRIGLVGNAGQSTGPHLHLEIHKNGNTVNPKDYIGKFY